MINKNIMQGVKDYEGYENLFNNDLVVAVRKCVEKIEEESDRDFQDSDEYNLLIDYLNRFRLWNKMTENEFMEKFTT